MFQDEKIPAEDLFRYTRPMVLSKRYVKFNLQQLIDVAVKASEGGRYCTRVLKCSEGLHNTAFILTMDNGAEVFAKLPNPNAGPPGYTTASEVATHVLLRDVLKIPVPRVLAWSFDAPNSPVEAEYIVTEKAPGIRLGSFWSQWPQEAKLKLIRQIVDIENRLTTISFPQHGCIYFKDDLRALTGDAEDINIESAAAESLSRFAIGPLTSTELWEGARRDMRLDRGTWHDPQEYTQALGRNEIAWIKSHACPRMNYYRSDQEHELPDDGVALLTKYMDVAPYLIPSPINETAMSKVIWHPDLHLDNVFIDPDTYEITSIVDWQSACIAPLFYQSGVPRMFRHPGPVREGWVVPERPGNFDTLSEDERRMIDKNLESETIHKYYEAQVYKRAPSHWDVLHDSSIPILRKPVWLVSGMWQNRDLFFLRQSLLSLATHWHEIFANDQLPCPIEFTEEELELYSKEEENIDGVGRMLVLFRDQGVLPVDGMVDPEDYENAIENSHRFKDIFVGLAKDEAERKLYEKLWPYQM
ncbi:phosphotransferase enzyme family protein [Aspergillus pseudonomiae]|uniref:Phosphotransferase enzyme family protein n=1 Tax=Aspergillus pseudonomiae TaxID=1506151 RepID=A0A5N7DPD2_9EURO|nr:phosphotransferase enzyme family protein [Aspergillus pseudonomiae]KAE8408302.1 phosphotransferase enzyme family protein [Aspergillus pseudonomiae]